MALVLKDRVKQTAAAPGTGTITLSGSVTGFQSFSAVGNGNSTYFAIYDPISGDWEVNYGTYTSSGTTLTRNATPLSSSNSGSLVNFTNTVDVFVTYPSENAVWRDTSGVVVQQSFGAITATSAGLTSGTITAAPTNATDIVNKEYADSISSGLNYHQPANYASTAALPAYTYNNGASGVGATITATANGALSLGGGSPTATQRVLVKDEIGGNAAYNGIYVVTQAGTSLLPFILTRATDYDTSGTGTNEIDQGDYVLVISGTLASTAWVQQTPLPITVGTTALTFLQFNAPITYYAGTGLTLSPATTFNIATTGVTAATYGSASSVPVITVNSQGQATVITNTAIAINGSAVSGNISGSAGSVANALTAGTYLTSGGTYDGSAARTFAVDATSANTASKIVARDSSGNFSAGTITATLSGAATSATTATNIAGGAANQIPYQTGAATTSFVTAPTVASTFLNWTGSAFAYSAISLPNNATFNNGGAGDASGTTFNGSAARTISYNTVGASPLAGSSSLTTTGTVTSGTWSASFGAVSGANLTSLTAGNLSGTIPSAVLGNSTAYVGTTAVALNRASGNLALTGILSETYVGTTSGTTQVIPNAVAGTGTVLTLPNTTGTLALTSDLPTVNNATLTMNTSGTGLSGSQTFTANQATGATFTVASNATSANTISTIVARDASGNFSAGTITATLTGQASSVANSLTAGTYLSGTAYNGSAAQTWTVDATSANTASKVVARDASGNFSAGTITAALTGNLNGGTLNGPLYTATYDNSSKVMFNSGGSYYLGLTGNVSTGGGSLSMVQYSNPDGTAAHAVNSYPLLHSNNYNSYAPTLTGTGASGTWSINVTGSSASCTGNAATASNASLLNSLSKIQMWNNSGQNHGTYQSFADIPNFGVWYMQNSAAGDSPQSGYQYYVQTQGLGNEYAYSSYALMTAIARSNATMYTFYRTREGGTWGSWIKASAGYADTAGSVDFANLTNKASGTGTYTTSGDYRAPIFYDSNDTGYYVDPNGTSNLNVSAFGRAYAGYDAGQSSSFSCSNWFRSSGNTGWYNASYAVGIYAIDSTWVRTYNSAQFYSDTIIQAGASVRAPIFYDSNNTGYYVDPNGTSNFAGLTVSSTISGSVSGSSNYTTTNYVGGQQLNPQTYFNNGVGLKVAMTAVAGYWSDTLWINGYSGGDVLSMCALHTQRNGQPRMYISSQQSTASSYGTLYEFPTYGNNYNSGALYAGIFYDSDNTGYYVDPASTSNVNQFQSDRTYGFSDIRSPIFYDYNNTGYYVDPASTSNINIVNAAGTCTFSGTVNFTNGSTYSAFMYGQGNTASVSGTGMNVYSTGGNGAVMAFHRGGYYAVNFGLDSDNVIRIGGWSASANRLQMDMSGNLTMAGNVTAYSDERLKKDWALLPDSFIESLAQLKSGTYTRIDSDERQAGISAQGLQKFLPEVVQTDASDTLSVNYGSAAMVSAVELAKEVVDLRARVAQLESLVNKLIGD